MASLLQNKAPLLEASFLSLSLSLLPLLSQTIRPSSNYAITNQQLQGNEAVTHCTRPVVLAGATAEVHALPSPVAVPVAPDALHEPHNRQ